MEVVSLVCFVFIWWFMMCMRSDPVPEYFYVAPQKCEGPFPKEHPKEPQHPEWDIDIVEALHYMIVTLYGASEAQADSVVAKLQRQYSMNHFLQLMNEHEDRDHFMQTMLEKYA